MANKPEASANPPIRTRVTSNAEGLAQPALAANVVSIAPEIAGFTASFYSVPSDVLESLPVKEQIQQQKDKPGISHVDVTIETVPSAKIFLPITTVAGLIQLLSDNLRAWNETYAGDLRKFMDNVKAGPMPAPGRKDN